VAETYCHSFKNSFTAKEANNSAKACAHWWLRTSIVSLVASTTSPSTFHTALGLVRAKPKNPKNVW
jgi:hypothetical protein